MYDNIFLLLSFKRSNNVAHVYIILRMYTNYIVKKPNLQILQINKYGRYLSKGTKYGRNKIQTTHIPTSKHMNEFWHIKQHCTLHQILKVRVDSSTNPRVQSCPPTRAHIYVVTQLKTQKQGKSYIWWSRKYRNSGLIHMVVL